MFLLNHSYAFFFLMSLEIYSYKLTLFKSEVNKAKIPLTSLFIRHPTSSVPVHFGLSAKKLSFLTIQKF